MTRAEPIPSGRSAAFERDRVVRLVAGDGYHVHRLIYDVREGGGVQLAIEFSEEERRQRQADVAYWRTRLAWFDRDLDLDTEPARIRGFYKVRARRVEPIGWPASGRTGG